MTKYVIDSSVLITCAIHTPFDYFPSMWEKYDLAVKEGKLLICDVVVSEISAKVDALSRWINNYKSYHKKAFVKDVIVESKLIINKYPNLVNVNNPNDQADPYLIAFAKINCLSILSDEVYSENAKKTRIPYVCKQEGIECVNRFEFFKRERWKF